MSPRDKLWLPGDATYYRSHEMGRLHEGIVLLLQLADERGLLTLMTTWEKKKMVQQHQSHSRLPATRMEYAEIKKPAPNMLTRLTHKESSDILTYMQGAEDDEHGIP